MCWLLKKLPVFRLTLLFILLQYTLKVRAFDGAFEDYCRVEIKIENVNDNPPVFLPYKNNITIMEEQLVPGCIVEVCSAYIFYNCQIELHH